MKISILAAAAALMSGACSAQAANIEFWYGNTGVVEKAIQDQCSAFNAAQSEHHITCVGRGSYEVSMQKAIAAFRANNHPVLIQFFDAGTLDLMLSDAVVPVQEELPEVKWDNYIAGARAYYETSGGTLFAQPYNASTLLFYTNKTELEKAGITKTPETRRDHRGRPQAEGFRSCLPLYHRWRYMARARTVFRPPWPADRLKA